VSPPLRPAPPRARQPSRPEIIDLVPETPVRERRRFDNPTPFEPLPFPKPPLVPGEFQRTMPSPPSPASLPVAETPDKASTLALRRRAEEAEKRERDALAQLEAARRSTAAPASDPLGDEAIGKLVKAVVSALTKRIGLPAVLIASLAGGGGLYKYATDKPTPPPMTAVELDARLAKFEERVGGRLDKLTTTVNDGVDLQRCLRKKTGQIGGSLLPAPDRMGSALKPQPFEDDCPDSPKRLPDPK
jgi:hypothetical protein